jgi:hypothetical protein
MNSQTIGVRKVEIFLTSALPGKLKKDLLALKMIKEADLECCAYHHLRRFLKGDSTWKVFVRKHSLHTGHFIDLIIFRRGYQESQSNSNGIGRGSLQKIAVVCAGA